MSEVLRQLARCFRFGSKLGYTCNQQLVLNVCRISEQADFGSRTCPIRGGDSGGWGGEYLYFLMEIYVLKIFRFLFVWDTVTEIFRCIQQYCVVKL